MRADIHDGPEQRSNERPDTLMQDHHLPGRQKNPLQRTGQEKTFEIRDSSHEVIAVATCGEEHQ
jgi:hypothetical protein